MIYLLHFNQAFKHAKHYIGFVESPDRLEGRLAKHSSNRGSKLMAAVSKAGIDFKLVRVWIEGDRNFERKLKNRKEGPTLCPVCNPTAANFAGYGQELISVNGIARSEFSVDNKNNELSLAQPMQIKSVLSATSTECLSERPKNDVLVASPLEIEGV